jgi:hypothetical protein
VFCCFASSSFGFGRPSGEVLFWQVACLGGHLHFPLAWLLYGLLLRS